MNLPLRRLLVPLAIAGAVVAAVIGGIAAAQSSPGEPADRRLVRLVAAYVAPDEAVVDDVVLVPGDHEDGAHRIENPDPATVSLPVAGDVVVTRVDCTGARGCAEGVAGDYDGLTRATDGTTLYAELTVEDGWIVRIDERYFA